MKLFKFIPVILPALLIIANCKSSGPPFTAPDHVKVTMINAQVYKLPGSDKSVTSFDFPQDHYRYILDSLDLAQSTSSPTDKWQALADIYITEPSGMTLVSIYRTYSALGAFSINGTYYRGGTDDEFLKIITDAYKDVNQDK